MTLVVICSYISVVPLCRAKPNGSNCSLSQVSSYCHLALQGSAALWQMQTMHEVNWGPAGSPLFDPMHATQFDGRGSSVIFHYKESEWKKEYRLNRTRKPEDREIIIRLIGFERRAFAVCSRAHRVSGCWLCRNIDLQRNISVSLITQCGDQNQSWLIIVVLLLPLN